MTPLQKLPKTVGDLSKIIVAKGFKKSPKVQKIAKSGLTGPNEHPDPDASGLVSRADCAQMANQPSYA